MTRAKWYSPQLSREIVSRLYFKAQAEGIAMTRLASRLIEEALGSNEAVTVIQPSENKPEDTPK